MSEELLSFDASGFQYCWDATSISSFEKCPRFYHLRHIEGWQPHEKSVHLIFGGLYASALEHFFKHLAAGLSRDEATIEVVLETLCETWVRPEPDEDGDVGPGRPWDSLHNAKTRETLVRSIVWYLDHFKDDPAPIVILSDGKPAVEYSFALPFHDEYIYCGHIDKLATYSGGTYIVDQKTSGATITPRFFEGFSPDVQMPGYTWAGKIIFDIPISGVIIDAAQIAVGFTRFERGFVQCPPAMLEEWHEETLQTIFAAKRAHEENYYPMNRASCGNYGGCEFRRVCSRSPEHRPAVLRSNFSRQARWDPLSRR